MGKWEANLPAVLNPEGEICVNVRIPNHPDYVKLFVRAVRMLEVNRMYERDDDHSAKIVCEQWANRTVSPLIEALANGNGCPEDTAEYDCLEFPAFASFIEFVPDNPFNPDEPIPDNYLTHAWWKWGRLETELPDWIDNPIADAIEALTQYQENDALTWLGSMPYNGIGEIIDNAFPFPYIKVHVTGSGAIRLNCLSFPLGGRIFAEVDEIPNVIDILSSSFLDPDSRVIDTDRDFTTFPMEQWPLISIKLDVVGEGDHIVYVMMFPKVEAGVDFFGFGGGLRSVELCNGLRPINTPEPPPPPLLEGITELKPEFQLTVDCGLEYRLRDQDNNIVQDWTSVAGWADYAAACFTGEDGADGASGADGANGQGFSPSSPTKPLEQSSLYPQISGDIVEPENSCDEDDKGRLWAAIKALVFKVHGYNQDLLNNFTNFTTPSEAYDMLSDFLPLLGGVSPTTANNLALALATNFETSYNSAVTEDFLMQVVEDLFCDAYGDCSFALEDFVDYVAGMAGGSYNAAVTTFLDVTSALTGATTGAEIFGGLSWLQFTTLGLNEKFGISQSIPNIINSISGQAASDEWKAYATDCYTHSGSWTVVIDLKGDYVKTGSEIVYRNASGLIKPSTVNSQGVALLEVQYGNGLHYIATSNQFANRELRIANAGALFIACRLNARKTAGTSTNMLIDCDSGGTTNAARQITNSSYTWTSGFPVANPAGTAGAITRWSLNFNQTLASNSCTGDLAYIEFTGTGELPVFN